jgi:hypothetical protein
LLDELQDARLTLEATRLALEAVYRSRSWRITKPIRAVTTPLRLLARTAVERVARRT